jgi:TetR/AcrR family transcriptional regulator, cholesterol catabolism regulator
VNQSQEYDNRIIDGAAELFRQYGIRAVTMDMIADQLGISKRTIYERFGDKDEMLFAVMNAMIIKQKEKIDSIIESSPDIISAIFTLLNLGRDHAASMNPIIGSDLRKYHSKVLERIKKKCENPDYEGALKIILTGKEQGLFRKDIDDGIVSRFFTELKTVIGDNKVFPAEEFLHRDLIKNVVLNYLRGIATEDGIKLIGRVESGMNN